MVTESDCRCLEAVRTGPGASGVNLRARNSRPQRAIVESSRLDLYSIVKLLGSFRVGWLLAARWRCAAVFLLPACGRGRHRVLEVAYVSAPQAALRDQVAAIFNRVGNVKNGERVEVLDREKRFARVRTATGIEGWIEQRFLVDQKTFDASAETHPGQSERSGAGSRSPAQRYQPARHSGPRDRTSVPAGVGRERSRF